MAAKSPPEKSKEPPRGISEDELKEFEDYMRRQENDSSPYHIPVTLSAGIGLILIEILRELRK